jgi:Protein of unknown function (DUF2934)
MDRSLEKRIRERAYEIWTACGHLHGQADQHWLAAEREILVASTTALAREQVPQKKKPPSPARSKRAIAKAFDPPVTEAERDALQLEAIKQSLMVQR